ncbi:uncharacterized protein LOC143300562 isoform X2 [Babylonia areolata]|uniref:uncharacterized protein LOC143300562 isoform X2 n=1 Tax=Babylonia areolata TaxID=304850 RepID=UPI003FD5C01E
MVRQWPVVAGIVLLLFVQETVTSRHPRVSIQAVGPTWISLMIWPSTSMRREVLGYSIMTRMASETNSTTQYVHRRGSEQSGTSVTLTDLEPNTEYVIGIRSQYANRRSSPVATTLSAWTKAEPDNREIVHIQKEEVSVSAGATKMSAVPYFVLGLHLLISWETTFCA